MPPIRQFEYLAPKTIAEAADFLSNHPEDSRVLAGGQSLIPLMKLNLVELKFLIDLKKIPDLSRVEIRKADDPTKKDTLVIGSLVTHSDIQHSSLVKEASPLLWRTAAGIGHPLVRNRGTIGGSVCHCDPSADYLATLLALDSKMIVESSKSGRREIDSEQFVLGPFLTDLRKGEILTNIEIPVAQANTGYSVKKLSLGHGSFPLVVVSVVLAFTEEENNICNKARVALAGVGEKPFRAKEAEELLLGEQQNTLLSSPAGKIEEASRKASSLCNPSADAEISSDYKIKMARILTRRALLEAFQTTGKSEREVP